jgi:hypothetical protein
MAIGLKALSDNSDSAQYLPQILLAGAACGTADAFRKNKIEN